MCTECENPLCNGKLNTLRQFSSWNDLASHSDEEIILKWVNERAAIDKELEELRTFRENYRFYGKRYRERQKQFASVAMHLLDPDEVAAIKQQVDEKLI